MITEIARREILEGLGEWRTYLAAVLMLLLVSLGLFVMSGDYERRLRAFEHQRAESTATHLLLPPTPLSVLARGLDEPLGREFRFDALDRGLVTVGARPEQTSLLFKLFATPDLAFVYLVVMSLVAFLFTYDAVSGDRASGTLQLVLAQPVPRSSLLLGKLAGRGALFLALALLGLLGETGWLIGAGLVPVEPPSLTRLGLFAVATLAYLLVFLVLGLLVSVACSRPSTSLAVLLLIWCSLVFVLPNLLPSVAQIARPLPSAQAVRQARVQAWVRSMFLQANGEEGAGAAVGGADRAERAVGGEERRRGDRILDDYRSRLEALVSTTQILERLSPAGCYLEAATATAGTGLAADMKLRRDVLRQRDRLLAGGPSAAGTPAARPPLRQALHESIIPCVGLLLAESTLLLTVALLVFSRADVRSR